MLHRLLVLQHQPDVPMATLGTSLEALGAELHVVELDHGDSIPAFDGYDGMIVLGGEMNTWQDGDHPWMLEEKAAIGQWVREDHGAFLGICLGLQLLADALGGEVGPAEIPEGGITTVRLTADGRADPVVGSLPDPVTVLHFHEAEVIRAPPGAVLLATNDQSPVQAMRVGRRAWGVQFHPEVGAATAREWGRLPQFIDLLDADRQRNAIPRPGGAPADAPPEPVGLRFEADLEAALPALDKVTEALAGAFIAELSRPEWEATSDR